MTIQRIVTERNITLLVHFTRIENLNSILTNGLLSITELEEYGINAIYNDALRLDFYPEAICVSISFPNYKLFYKFRTESSGDWVVLAINPSILWEKECIFCTENAARSTVSNIPSKERSGVEGFKKIFEEIPGMPNRSVRNLPTNFPSHPQAEVLILEKIEPNYLLGVFFESREHLNRYRRTINSNIPLSDWKYLFDARLDYEYWR